MHRLSALALAVIIPFAPPVMASAASRSIAVPADSFINRHVDTLPQLTRQISVDPTVRRRLARHFHISGPAVVQYIQNNLVLRTIPRTRRAEVYCVSRTGYEYTIQAKLPAGTPVFVLRATGEPILKLACGNPLVSALPVVKKAGSSEALPEFADLRSVPSAPAKIAPKLASAGSKVISMTGNPFSSLPAVPVTKVAGGLYELSPHSSRSPLGYLLGVPLAAGFIRHGGSKGSLSFGGTDSGGGLSTFNTGLNNGSNTGNLSSVPEPGEALAFAIGAAGIALLLFCARRRRRAPR
jgi:hypothetical protein